MVSLSCASVLVDEDNEVILLTPVLHINECKCTSNLRPIMFIALSSRKYLAQHKFINNVTIMLSCKFKYINSDLSIETVTRSRCRPTFL